MRWALDQSIDNPWVRDESLARMLGASGVVRAHQFVTLLRKQRVELVETLPLALFLFLSLLLLWALRYMMTVATSTSSIKRQAIATGALWSRRWYCKVSRPSSNGCRQDVPLGGRFRNRAPLNASPPPHASTP